MALTEKFIKPADYPGTRNTDVLCGWDLTEKGREIKIRENQTRGINWGLFDRNPNGKGQLVEE
jgi:hypothetical protein